MTSSPSPPTTSLKSMSARWRTRRPAPPRFPGSPGPRRCRSWRRVTDRAISLPPASSPMRGMARRTGGLHLLSLYMYTDCHSMSPSLLHVLHLMREARATALEEGVAITFPFKANDVEAIHSCFQKYGRGVYFRLKDGRVFSAFGIELDPNPALLRHGPSESARVPVPRQHPACPNLLAHRAPDVAAFPVGKPVNRGCQPSSAWCAPPAARCAAPLTRAPRRQRAAPEAVRPVPACASSNAGHAGCVRSSFSASTRLSNSFWPSSAAASAQARNPPMRVVRLLAGDAAGTSRHATRYRGAAAGSASAHGISASALRAASRARPSAIPATATARHPTPSPPRSAAAASGFRPRRGATPPDAARRKSGRPRSDASPPIPAAARRPRVRAAAPSARKTHRPSPPRAIVFRISSALESAMEGAPENACPSSSTKSSRCTRSPSKSWHAQASWKRRRCIHDRAVRRTPRPLIQPADRLLRRRRRVPARLPSEILQVRKSANSRDQSVCPVKRTPHIA